jgi:hypothetical protein
VVLEQRELPAHRGLVDRHHVDEVGRAQRPSIGDQVEQHEQAPIDALVDAHRHALRQPRMTSESDEIGERGVEPLVENVIPASQRPLLRQLMAGI